MGPFADDSRNADNRPYADLNDSEILEIAIRARRRVDDLPLASAARANQWEIFSDAMGELARRGMRATTEQIRRAMEADSQA